MAGTPLQIIAGLGNPGPEHRLTRHNAGFWFVDALARSLGAQFRSHARYQGEICRVTLEGSDLVLLKPQTYMNRSGLSIRALLDYEKSPIASCSSCTTTSTCRRGSRGSSWAAATAATTACAT
jgi:PTH1 family peptidyl-tRNA hydrolase